MACDYIIPMSQERLSDTEIESLTSEFGAKVGFNTVELQGVRGMIRKAKNAADVTRHKIQRALLTNKHDPNRNQGLDNAKEKRDNEYQYKHDKQVLKNEERTERQNIRNNRRGANHERVEKYQEIKNQKEQRTTHRKEVRDTERGHGVAYNTRSRDSHNNQHTRFPVHNPPHRQTHTQGNHAGHGDDADEKDPYDRWPHGTKHETQ